MAAEEHDAMMTQRARHFSFQLQFTPGAAVDRDLVNRITTIVERGGAHVTNLSLDQENGESFATLTVEAPDASAFWRKTKSKLITASRSASSKGMIAVCEGDDGWNDYLLLHHFDLSQRTDELPERPAHRAAE